MLMSQRRDRHSRGATKGVTLARILIIDDEPLFLDILTMTISGAGHDVETASGGADGVDQALASPPDLVITDLSMPEVTGWDVIRRLKSEEATGGVPIMALSAHEQSGDRDEAFAAGCDAYETKPLDFPRLAAKVEELLAGD